jgi:acyl-CoA thioesterase FadM
MSEGNLAATHDSQPVQVYFNDLDAFGMVNHAYYAVLIDRAWWPFRAQGLSPRIRVLEVLI